LTHVSVNEQEKTVESIIQELTSILVRQRGHTVNEPEEIKDVLESSTTFTNSSRKQRVTFSENNLDYSCCLENEIVQVDIRKPL